jgi:hypothetical protein
VSKVFVVTDDPATPDKLQQEWNHVFKDSESKREAKFVYRVATTRLDNVNQHTEDELASLVDVLVDLRILASVDVFVGTGSSNFGDMAYYLRGGVHSYNVENKEHGYRWVANKLG